MAIGQGTSQTGMEQPVTWWPKPSTAPSGMAFYTSDKFPAWTGSLFVGALAGQTLWRLSLSGDQVVATESLLGDRGQRIRDVVQGPDGWLYLLTDSSDGQILRLEGRR
jgi:glucose/arabinose dehydrogenase